MMERLTEESARAERYGDPLSMILIDIDHFKSINDEFGHGTGDRVLIDTTYILKNGIRETDTCARWGGEEFLICLPHTRIDDAVKVAEKLRQSVAENTITCEGADVRITISAGVARYKQGYGVDDFISAADDSLYEAKRLGRNRVAKADGTQPP
jgi:diguanylate cyclase (GGDEF)-like protein